MVKSKEGRVTWTKSHTGSWERADQIRDPSQIRMTRLKSTYHPPEKERGGGGEYILHQKRTERRIGVSKGEGLAFVMIRRQLDDKSGEPTWGV